MIPGTMTLKNSEGIPATVACAICANCESVGPITIDSMGRIGIWKHTCPRKEGEIGEGGP